MANSFESTFIAIYRSLYVWRFFYRSTGPVLGYHFRLIEALDQFEDDPLLQPLANICAVHLLMSARTLLTGGRSGAARQRLARYRCPDAALDLLNETLETKKGSLSPKSRALLCLTGFWIHQRKASAVGAGGVQEQSYMLVRMHRLQEWREKAFEHLEFLCEIDRAIALAMLSAGDGDGAEVHTFLQRLGETWWQDGVPDEAIYTLRDQINKTFMDAPCFWLFDATMASLIQDRNSMILTGARRAARTARQAKLTALQNRYCADHPERGNDRQLRYSVQHRGWRVHAVAAAREVTLIDDIIDANLTDESIAKLLYRFDAYRSTGTALARFRAHLARYEIKLTVPLNDTDLNEIARQDKFYASLPSQRKR